MAVQDTVDNCHCDCTEKHDVLSEHRYESKVKEFPEHRDGSKFWTSHHEHRDGHDPEQWLRTSRWANRPQTEDRDQDMKEFTQNEFEGSKNGARKTQRLRDEHAFESKVGTREHEIIHGKVPDESKVIKC